MTAPPVDWVALAQRMNKVRTEMTHHEDTGLTGLEFDAELLRRTFGYSANDGTDGHRKLPYETVDTSTGLVTLAEADHLRDGHTALDRARREDAERRAEQAWAETRRVGLEARRDIAAALRRWCSERTVPSRYRREGVLLAADQVDPRDDESEASDG